MPELPEVETVKRVLTPNVVGKKISEVIVKRDKFIHNYDPNKFCEVLVSQSFTNIRRVGKYLLFDLNDYTLVSHLRMEGKYNFYNIDVEDLKHDYIIFRFTDGSVLKYNDSRQFGTMELVDYQQENTLKGIVKLGLEPFDEKLNADYILERLKNRNPEIKKMLLDQTIITGFGNIYVDEVLYVCNIHPETKVKSLSKRKLNQLIEEGQKLLQSSINMGGTTVKSFSVSGDVSGGFQYSLNAYGKAGSECPKCLSEFKKIKVGGRGTTYCPKCQRKKSWK